MGLLKLIGHHDNMTITLVRFLIWDNLEIDQSQVEILVNGKELNSPPIITIPINTQI